MMSPIQAVRDPPISHQPGEQPQNAPDHVSKNGSKCHNVSVHAMMDALTCDGPVQQSGIGGV